MKTIVCTWTGEAFVPLGSFLEGLTYEKGERVALQEAEEVDHSLDKFRAAYFAQVREAWSNLDENAAKRYETPNALRRWALVKAGWRTEHPLVCDTVQHALVSMAFLSRLNKHAVIVQRENVVMVYLARSQQLRRKNESEESDRMTRDEFKQSADDVLAILRETIHVTKADLERAGRANANG